MKQSPAIRAVDESFFDGARKALADAGLGALEFLAANPGASNVELAKRLNRGASGKGMTIAIYRDAETKGCVRDAAMWLLIGKILEEFPDGWGFFGNIAPSVRIGGWRSDIKRHVNDPQIGEYASAIIRELAIENQPPDGWKPAVQDDPLINELFDRFWPADAHA